MKMIPTIFKKLKITNFQAHEQKIVKFSAGITSIVGPSDIGKSAIIRAIRWLCQNDPSGEEFRRWDTDMTTVGLMVGKDLIQRKRGKGINSYTIHGKENKAFGRDVPLDVAETLGVGPINFQAQHDGHYWFNLSAGQVSQQLNEMVDLSLIDSSTAHINNKIRSASAERSVVMDRISTLQEEVSSLEYIGQMDAELKAVSQKFAILAQKREQTEDLKDHIELLQEAQYSRDKTEKELSLLEAVVVAGEIWREAQTTRTELCNLMEGLEEASTESNKSIPSLTVLKIACDREAEILKNRAELVELLDNLETAEAEETNHQLALEKAKTEWEELRKDRCPLCGRTG